MRTIGFNFTTNDFRYAVLEDNFRKPKIIEKNRIIYPKTLNISQLTGWFETQINLIIGKHQPNKIGYKISITLTAVNQIQNSIYPLGILCLSCNKKGIVPQHFTSGGLNATKFGLTRKDDVYAYIDSILGLNPPYWDKPTKDALLSAWFLLNK